MFIRSQNKIQVIDMGKVTRIYAEDINYGEKQVNINPPYRIFASDGIGIEPLLGEYESKDRAFCVLDEICEMLQSTEPNYVYYMLQN